MIRFLTDPELLPDAALLAEYLSSEAEADDKRQTDLAIEIERRNLDL